MSGNFLYFFPKSCSDALGTEILLVVDHPRLEEKLILKSLRERGLHFSLLNVKTHPLPINGLKMRSISLIRAVGMFGGARAAAVLESMGSHTINSSLTILACGDKVLTYSILSRSGLPIPKSFLALGKEAALEAYYSFKGVAVDKPPIGSWGRMVSKVKSREVVEQIAEAREIMSSSLRGHIIQEYVETGGKDIRCLVLGGVLLGCVERVASVGWRSNVALGAVARSIKVSGELEELPIRAAESVGGEFVAVDLFANDGLLVNEVNGVPEFKGFMRATSMNVPDLLVSHVREVLRS